MREPSFLLRLSVCSVWLGMAGGAAGQTWNPVAPMLTRREGHAAATANGKIYVFGGNPDDEQMYDPGTDTWSLIARMPTARSGPAAAATSTGNIYVMGGTAFDISSTILDTLEVYDPAADNWTTLAPMPTPRYFLAAAEVAGEIYAIGGRTPTGATDKVEVYDPASNTWSSVAPLPVQNQSLAAAVLDGKIYAVGGGAPVGLDGRIYAIGGDFDRDMGPSTVEAY